MNHETLEILNQKFPMFDWVAQTEVTGSATNNGSHGYNSAHKLHFELSYSDVFGCMVKAWIQGVDRWHFGKGKLETDVIVSVVQSLLRDIGYHLP
jgi:hypothetical protein